MEEIKREEEGAQRADDRAWFLSHRSWAHWRWVRALIGLVVLAIVFGLGVKFGEFKGRFFGGRFGSFGGGHFYSSPWRGSCWEGGVPMMYGGQYQGQYDSYNQNVPFGVMREYYQGQNQGATTTPQAVPSQP